MGSARSALLLVWKLMGGVEPRFEGLREGAGFGFAAESHSMLVEADLPLGFSHFFYQDLHC